MSGKVTALVGRRIGQDGSVPGADDRAGATTERGHGLPRRRPRHPRARSGPVLLLFFITLKPRVE